MADSEINDSRREWRRVGLIVAGLLVATAVLWALRGRTFGESFQIGWRWFGTLLAFAMAVLGWVAGPLLVWYALRQERGAMRSKLLLGGLFILALAAGYTWSLIEFFSLAG